MDVSRTNLPPGDRAFVTPAYRESPGGSFVFPFFLFAMGAAFPFRSKKYLRKGILSYDCGL
ncbi:DUF5009 domain-containing protein [Bacteroides ovatus]|nr:DUF5009 domain-containing protein [Bacteroides ovatus]